MKICTITRVVICAALLTGCVSTGTHKQTLAELEQARKALESSKMQAAAEADRLQKQLVDVNTRVAGLMSGTTTAQEEIARLQKRASELEAETARANELVKQVSDIMKNVTDKQIRIEGHTDNVPIGAKLKERFQTNWELSTARATSVVRYLIEDGGVDRANLLAVGYADTKPLASNDTEEGRTANRRIEIALYPKDLSEIANQLKP